MDLNKILGHLENSAELIKQIELEVGRDFVPRTDFNAKNTELKNLETQVGELNSSLTSLSKEKESFDKTLADLNGEVKTYKLRDMKIRIAREKGIPYEMADRLTGEDEKALAADADSLSKLISTVSKPTVPPPLKSTEPTGDGKDSAYKALLTNIKGE
jgi:chromosome segregation ATPase